MTQAPPVSLHVGTYADAGGEGLYPLGGIDGEWRLGEPYPGAANVSFGVHSGRFGLHYLVDEQAEGAIGVFRETLEGWEQLARVSTHGAAPCYLALDNGESWLIAANYESGSIALFRLDTRSGIPVEPPTVQTGRGSGPVPERQEGPHAHCVRFAPDQNWLYHVDLGADEIVTYPFNQFRGLGEARTGFEAPPGSGPRHLLFHPDRPLALLVSELASTLTLLQVANGGLAAKQTLSTLPDGFEGESLGGHLALNQAGDRAYVSNRGHDSIAVFAVDDGGLVLLQHVPSGGASPRFFLLLEAQRLLVLANEGGGNLTFFDVLADGKLAPRGEEISVPGPAFLFAGHSDT
jgi:6-phosphogluconolactonase